MGTNKRYGVEAVVVQATGIIQDTLLGGCIKHDGDPETAHLGGEEDSVIVVQLDLVW